MQGCLILRRGQGLLNTERGNNAGMFNTEEG